MKKFQWKKVTERFKKGKKKWIITVVVLCVVVAGAGRMISRKSKMQGVETTKQMETTVSTGTIQTSVSGTGTISYADSTDIVVPSDLEIKELLVNEGSYVTEGTLLATVDETSLTACLSTVQEAISEVDSTISSEKSSSTTQSVKAGVAGRVKKIYADEDDSVVTVMKEQGALMLLSTDDYMAVKIEGAANVSAGDEVTVSCGDTSTDGTVDSIENGTAIILFDDSVFEYEAEVTVTNADDVTLGKGTAYIHAPLKVVATGGTVSSLNVSLNASVSASTKVYTLDSNAQSATYAQAVKEREELVALLDTLIAIQVDGGIVATTDGMVESIGISGSSSSESSSSGGGMVMGDNDVEENENKSEATEVAEITENTVEEAVESDLAQAEGSVEAEGKAVEMVSSNTSSNTGFVTMSTANVTESLGTQDTTSEETEDETVSKTAIAAPGDLTGGAGVITGTTVEMEYAASADATEWTDCTADSTKVAAGTWYVRYKETDTTQASPVVKVVVTEEKTSEESTESSQEQPGQNSDTTANNKSSENSTSDKGTQTDSATQKQASSSAGASKSGSSGGSGSSSSASSTSTSSSDTSSVETVSAFVVANGDKMMVTMNVDELDILSMKEGLEAEITLDAVEGTTFTGEITSVSGSASASGGVAQYPVEVTFEKTEDMLSGMNASVEIIMEQAENVLVVPLAAVVDEGNKSYVYTGYDKSSGELTDKVEVTLGISDETNVEIQGGLSEGDTVYYQMKGSEESSSQSESGMGGFGMPSGMDGMPSGGQGDMKMNGERPNGGGNRSNMGGQGK